MTDGPLEHSYAASGSGLQRLSDLKKHPSMMDRIEQLLWRAIMEDQGQRPHTPEG